MKRKNLRKVVKKRKFSVTHASFLFLSVLALFFSLTVALGKENFSFTGNAISDLTEDIKDFFGISSLSTTSVTRSFSVNEYTPGTAINVKLSINVGVTDKIINYGVEEYVPSGWIIVSADSSDYSSISGSKISWIINSSNNVTYLLNKDLSYTVIPLSSDSGAKSFASNILFTSMSSGSPIAESLAVSGTTSITSVETPNSGNSGSGSGGRGGSGSKPVTNVNTSNGSVSTGNLVNNSGVIEQEETPLEENPSLEIPIETNKSPAFTYIVFGILLVLIVAIVITFILLRKNKPSSIPALEQI